MNSKLCNKLLREGAKTLDRSSHFPLPLSTLDGEGEGLVFIKTNFWKVIFGVELKYNGDNVVQFSHFGRKIQCKQLGTVQATRYEEY